MHHMRPLDPPGLRPPPPHTRAHARTTARPQNKIDLVTEAVAVNQQDAIQKFIQGTGAPGVDAPGVDGGRGSQAAAPSLAPTHPCSKPECPPSSSPTCEQGGLSQLTCSYLPSLHSPPAPTVDELSRHLPNPPFLPCPTPSLPSPTPLRP